MGLRLRFRSVCVCKGALTWRSHSRALALLHVCISSYFVELWADLPRTGSVVTGFERWPFSSTICMGYCKILCFGATDPSGTRPPHSWGFYITHDAPQSVVLLWTSDQPVAETSTWQQTTLARDTSMPPVGFEPTISAGERPQTYALDCADTGTGCSIYS